MSIIQVALSLAPLRVFAAATRRAAILVALFAGAPVAAAAPATEMPRIAKADGRFTLFVDGKPFFVLAAQLHNSSAWPGALDEAWDAAVKLSPNVIEAPVYWEQFEPEPGRYDATNVDALVAKARQSGKRLILLWFGTWKNGQNHYTPTWMRKDIVTYPRMLDPRGEPVDVQSPHGPANLAADQRAYVALMRHLKAIDGDR